MKTLIISFIFLFFTAAINAQQSSSNTVTDQKEQSISDVKKIDLLGAKASVTHNAAEAENICYSETSKVAFFEVLINQNGFDIQLKESNDLVIKNTEEIINKNKDQILYSEED